MNSQSKSFEKQKMDKIFAKSDQYEKLINSNQKKNQYDINKQALSQSTEQKKQQPVKYANLNDSYSNVKSNNKVENQNSAYCFPIDQSTVYADTYIGDFIKAVSFQSQQKQQSRKTKIINKDKRQKSKSPNYTNNRKKTPQITNKNKTPQITNRKKTPEITNRKKTPENNLISPNKAQQKRPPKDFSLLDHCECRNNYCKSQSFCACQYNKRFCSQKCKCDINECCNLSQIQKQMQKQMIQKNNNLKQSGQSVESKASPLQDMQFEPIDLFKIFSGGKFARSLRDNNTMIDQNEQK